VTARAFPLTRGPQNQTLPVRSVTG
jgi:hypothetical protein